MPIKSTFSTAALTLLSSLPAFAQDIDFGGEIAFEARGFLDTPAWPGQSDEFQTSIALQPEIGWTSSDGHHRLSFTGFWREDSIDDNRSHGDIREAYYGYSSGGWDITAGINRVFWGVTESRHLVNIINQVDALEDIDDEDALGQPMFQIARQTGIGRFELFLMPGFRERQFPGPEGRLRTPLPVDEHAATFESRHGTERPEVALRYSHYIGDLDIGVHYFNGTSREPTLTPNAGSTALEPFYPEISQFGVDLQLTNDAALWKFEGIWREGQGESFGAVAAGVEYTLYQIGGTDKDLGLIAEALWDGRDASVFPTIYDQDVFLGARLAFNDTADTSVIVGLLTDLETGPTALRIEAERRLGESWALEAVGQVFFQDDTADPAQAFERDSYLAIELKRFF